MKHRLHDEKKEREDYSQEWNRIARAPVTIHMGWWYNLSDNDRNAGREQQDKKEQLKGKRKLSHILLTDSGKLATLQRSCVGETPPVHQKSTNPLNRFEKEYRDRLRCPAIRTIHIDANLHCHKHEKPPQTAYLQEHQCDTFKKHTVRTHKPVLYFPEELINLNFGRILF